MELNYKEYGEGSPLIILHGLLGTSDNWVTIARKLGEHYHVYLPDQRNHGSSPWSDTWSYPAMMEDLGEFMEKHQIEQASIVGHSMGGKVAMYFATHYPDKLAKLVVVDIAPRVYPVQHDPILKGLLAVDLSQLKARRDADKALEPAFPDFGMRQFLLKNLKRNPDNSFYWQANLSLIQDKLEEVSQTFPDHLRFEKPSLFIRGLKSDYIRPEDEALIHHYFPDAQITSIEKAGHWVHAEAPQEFLAALTSYLK